MAVQRLAHLDGIRGMAAFSVFVCHYIQVFLPHIYYVNALEGHGLWEDHFAMSPFNIVVNGNFAVCLFFVLSGYVLSAGFIERGDLATVRRLAVKRYVRLAVPVLGAVMLAWIILALDGYRYSVAQVMTRSGMRDAYATFMPFWGALEQGAIGAFFRREWSLDPVLWTMQTELYGSFVVFALLALFGQDRRRWVVYPVAIAVFYDSYYLAFVLGIVLADVQNRWAERASSLGEVILLVGVGLYFGSYPYYGAEQGLWSILPMIGDAEKVVLYHVLGAFILILAACQCAQARSILGRSWFRFLGRISYSLYLIHFPLVCSLVSGTWLTLMPHFSYTVTTALTFVVTAPLVVAAAFVFAVAIDEPTIRLSERFARFVECRATVPRAPGA